MAAPGSHGSGSGVPTASRPLTLLRWTTAAFAAHAAFLGLALATGPAAPSAAGHSAAAALVEALRTSGSVRPPSPAGHPVSAVYNREAVVPPQCYTRTDAYFNPCYVCHQDAIPGRENVMNDRDLQEAYSFSEPGMTNHWANLFEDRSERAGRISDAEILAYIAGDNYTELPGRLREASFSGWIPDLAGLQEGAAAFDEHGFARDGSHWVAFNYKPFPSTFWPTNGSTDDVALRLPAEFRSTAEGAYSRDVYRANLAILEARIKGVGEIGCLPVDEAVVGRDLDGDGRLGLARTIRVVEAWVGAARHRFIDNHLYPAGTEFLHTVRYVGVSRDGQIGPSRRMKEVRYMKKWKDIAKPVYARKYQLEAYDKEAGYLPGYLSVGDWGLDNGIGWSIQGFIEDGAGRLRVSTYEENLACMGCHNSVGSTIDKTFSLARKVDGADGWGYLDLRGMPDAPSRGESAGEIATYLERVGGGSEFRNNDEMARRWFLPDGTLDRDKVAAARDVHALITPSPERALALNKAYRVIVQDQDFVNGRDATLAPPRNVYPQVDNTTAPRLPPERVYRYNIILDWERR